MPTAYESLKRPFGNPLTDDTPYNNVVHVEDLCRLTAGLLERDIHGFTPAPLGTAGTLPLIDAVERLMSGMGRRVPIRVSGRSAHSFTISNRKAADEWGYAPMDIARLLDRYAGEDAPMSVTHL